MASSITPGPSAVHARRGPSHGPRRAAPSSRLRRVRMLPAGAHPTRAAAAVAAGLRWAARARHGVLFYPVVLSAVGVLGAHLMLAVDGLVQAGTLPIWATLTPSAATTLLATLAGALITVVGLLFWVRAAQVSLAATQFSARMLTGYLGDRRLQLTMGFVIGAFSYVVAVLAHIPAPADGAPGLTPDLAVVVAIVGVLAAVLRIVAAVMYGARMTHASEIVDSIAQATVARIRQDGVPGVTGDDDEANEGVRALPDLDARPLVPVEAPTSGWVRDVDEDALLDALGPNEVVSLRVRLGEFVTEGQTVAVVWPRPAPSPVEADPAGEDGGDGEDAGRPVAAGEDPQAAADPTAGEHQAADGAIASADPSLHEPPGPVVDHEAVTGALTVGSSRSVATDVSYGLAQLVDVVQRALAPGNNDLTAASEAIQRLGVVLRELMIRDDHATSRVDEHRRWVLRPRELGTAGYLRLAFERVRIDGAAYPSVTAELLGTLGMLRAAALRAGRPDRAALCAQQARRLLSSASQSGTSADDQAELLVRAEELGLVRLGAIGKDGRSIGRAGASAAPGDPAATGDDAAASAGAAVGSEPGAWPGDRAEAAMPGAAPGAAPGRGTGGPGTHAILAPTDGEDDDLDGSASIGSLAAHRLALARR